MFPYVHIKITAVPHQSFVIRELKESMYLKLLGQCLVHSELSVGASCESIPVLIWMKAVVVIWMSLFQDVGVPVPAPQDLYTPGNMDAIDDNGGVGGVLGDKWRSTGSRKNIFLLSPCR